MNENSIVRRVVPQFASVVVPFLALLTLASCAEVRMPPGQYAGELSGRSAETVERFKTDPNMRDFAKYIPGAKAIVVLPHVYKAAFIGGAEGGSGMLLARKAGGGWSDPAFYTLAAGSLGFQAGIQDVEMILIVRSEKALNAIVKHQAKFGADTGITVGIYGAGAEGATTTNVGPDVLAFARSRIGIYAGISLEGSGLVRRKDLIEAAYGAGATPQAILDPGRPASYAPADALRRALGG